MFKEGDLVEVLPFFSWYPEDEKWVGRIVRLSYGPFSWIGWYGDEHVYLAEGEFKHVEMD